METRAMPAWIEFYRGVARGSMAKPSEYTRG
jgi:hypothetical protein